jgi:Uma2 family endonuclease
VLSPNDRIGKVTRRVAEFHKAGIPLVWVVDPEACDVTVYRTGRDAYAVEQGQELTGDDVLPDFRCRIDEFFLTNDEPPDTPG